MEYNAYLIPLATGFSGAVALILIGPDWLRSIAWVGLYGLAFIAALDQVQNGGNYLLWNIIAWIVGCLGGLETKKLRPDRLPKRERKAMTQLFERQWWRVFTEDSRLQFDCTITCKDPIL